MISCVCIENEPVGNITRIQSLRRSFRNSFRRRRTGSVSVRTRNTTSVTTDERTSASEKKRRPRATSEPVSGIAADPTDGMPLTREQQGIVNDLLLAETYATGNVIHQYFTPCDIIKLVSPLNIHIFYKWLCFYTQARIMWRRVCLLLPLVP